MNKIKVTENISFSDSLYESNHTRKVWDINWDCKADATIFYIDELVNEAFSLPMTKRSILKISAKIIFYFNELYMKDFCYLRPRDYFKDKCRDISPPWTYITNYNTIHVISNNMDKQI